MNRAIEQNLKAKAKLTEATRDVVDAEARRLIEKNLNKIIANPRGDWGKAIGRAVGARVVKRVGKRLVKESKASADRVLAFVGN